MIAVLAVCLALAVVAVVWLAARSATLGKQLTAANERVSALEDHLNAAREESRAIDVARVDAVEQLEQARSDAARAETARAELEVTVSAERERADLAQAHAARVQEDADAAARERDAARAQLAETGWGSGAGPDTLWALELARTERTWRTSVAADPTSDVFEPGPDALKAAVLTDVAAAREDAGVDVKVEWELVDQLEPLAALAVLRSAQELVAGATRLADEARLVVEPDGDDVVVRVAEPDGTAGRFAELQVVGDGRGLSTTAGGVRILGAVTRQPV